MAAWRPRELDEFFALTMACRGIAKSKHPVRDIASAPGGMHSLQSMDGSVLRLHSCRALSPKPQDKVAQPPTTKKLAFGLLNRFCESIEHFKPEDQLCSWKLKQF
jgi:hypothetical protein